ncbi:lipase family protein [Nocardia pseudobrasiliensis]|uniref:Acetyl esterase/lipase n=1 Tax=Nocardia pseudobrasiliensis TaxID=45979 RepID=A0A370I6F2_9NOCA|nr:alpha/beta hydrolase [Nocardia pseudobrasiliensis]RDI66306.1 acetyl esterase/lipase [Nocardia pseudobrasiliensis]
MRKLLTTAVLTVASATGLLGLPIAQAAPATGVVRSVEPLSAAATLPGSVNSERLLYSTTTVGDQPTVASAAVYFPPGEAPAGGWPIIAWAHGTVGLGDDCAYSVGGPAEVARDWAYLGTWLKQGYAIVAADYAGLGTPGEHPYLDGVVEAHNVVDAVRAASDHYGSLAKKWVVVGQSQGGGAAVATARHATEFGGPELDYRGAVATGTPAYIEDILQPLGPGVPPVKLSKDTTAYVLFILNGLRTAHPELNIDSFLTDAGREWVARGQRECVGALAEDASEHNVVVGDLFARPLSQIPDLHGLLYNYLGLPETGYDKPLFMGQGLRDTDVITPETLRFAAVLQANGQPVTFKTYPTDHSGTVNASLVDSVPFVRNLFA